MIASQLRTKASRANNTRVIAQFCTQDRSFRGRGKSSGACTMHSSFKEKIDRLDDATTQDNAIRIVEVQDRAKRTSQVIASFHNNFYRQLILLLNSIGENARTDNGFSLAQLSRGIIGENRGTAMMNFGHNGLQIGRAS